jgi:hypothetical protein
VSYGAFRLGLFPNEICTGDGASIVDWQARRSSQMQCLLTIQGICGVRMVVTFDNSDNRTQRLTELGQHAEEFRDQPLTLPATRHRPQRRRGTGVPGRSKFEKSYKNGAGMQLHFGVL